MENSRIENKKNLKKPGKLMTSSLCRVGAAFRKEKKGATRGAQKKKTAPPIFCSFFFYSSLNHM